MARGSNLQSQASVRSNGSSGGNLSNSKSGGNLSSKPSWTKLQQDNLKAKRARTAHQSQGFNGLVRAE